LAKQQSASQEPQVSSLVDRWGRRITRLRLAVSDQCSFRCHYCRPRPADEGTIAGRLLSADEIIMVAEAAVECGIRSIRLTGGEPLLRPGLTGIVRRLSQLGTGLDIALTTNGLLLKQMAAELAEAGLSRVNVSLDSLRGDRFREITGQDSLGNVLEGLKAAESAGLRPIKLNVVLMRGQNDNEILDMVRLAGDAGRHLRFIEFMPLDGREEWLPSATVYVDEVRERIEEVFALTPLPPDESPGDHYLLGEGATTVSLIGAISHPFCDRCNRLRVTADGFLRACLFSQSEQDLRPALSSGEPRAALVAAYTAAVAAKPAGHDMSEEGFVRPARAMFAIGG